MNDYTGTFEMVDPRVIVIDHRFQRPQKSGLIQKIAQDPTWEAFGVPVCFKRSNGLLYAADGQQRIQGVLKSENPPRLIPIVWFPMEGLSAEADVFVRINEWRKQLLPLEKHKSKVVAEDEGALAVERACALVGYSIGNWNAGTSARTVQAVGTLNEIYNTIGEEGLVQTLTCIRDAWDGEGDAISVHILRGVANLVEEQGENYNRARTVAGMKKTTPGQVLRKADGLRYDFGGSKALNVRRAFDALTPLKLPKQKKKAA